MRASRAEKVAVRPRKRFDYSTLQSIVDKESANRFMASTSRLTIDSTLCRPVLLVDEAQEMTSAVLNELRLLSSARFDARQLLAIVLSGDGRLVDKLRREELLPLGSRIRSRLKLDVAEPDELVAAIDHLLAVAGNETLMTRELINTLSEHALGNYRVLTGLSSELLVAAAHKELPQLDEKLYFEVFQPSKPFTKTAQSRSGRLS